MKRDSQTIEQIVAEVVRRLSRLADPPPAAPLVAPSAPGPSSSATSAAATHPDTLVLDARVITTATVHGRLNGLRRVVVNSRAVVTPSVKDDLQKRHIRLEYQEAVATQADSDELTVVRYTRAADVARAMATLPLPSGAAERLLDELSAAVTAAAQAVGSDRQVSVLVTDESLAAVCLLNRAAHVRAAQARSVEEVRRAVSAIGANVLVIDPRDMTANQWIVAIQLFRKDLPRHCAVGLEV